LIPNFKRENPSYPLSNIDINVYILFFFISKLKDIQAPLENLENKIAQTTTRIPNFSGEVLQQRVTII